MRISVTFRVQISGSQETGKGLGKFGVLRKIAKDTLDPAPGIVFQWRKR